MTYRELYEYGKKQLEDAGIEEAALDARLLLEYICHTDRNALLVHGDSGRIRVGKFRTRRRSAATVSRRWVW